MILYYTFSRLSTLLPEIAVFRASFVFGRLQTLDFFPRFPYTERKRGKAALREGKMKAIEKALKKQLILAIVFSCMLVAGVPMIWRLAT